MSEKGTPARARQACEPCRRKKTKCPGEKPVCSFCQRLGQRCSYEKSDGVIARVHKNRRSISEDSTGPKDRLQRLEHRVEEVFDILSNLAGSASAGAGPAQEQHPQPSGTTITRSITPTRDSPPAETASQTPRFDAVHSPEPPDDIWPALIVQYRKHIDCQPLSVLSFQSLSLSPRRWPRSLRRSFLSLTIQFVTDHEFFRSRYDEAVSFYANSARQEVLSSAGRGEVSFELLQTTCLCALRDIIAGNSLAVWLSISLGIRLALSTGVMSNRRDTKVTIDHGNRSRCCWSLFALDRFYGSTLTVPSALSIESVLPDYPASTQSPNSSKRVTDLPLQTPSVKDQGVSANYLQLLSMWGMAMNYVQSVKDGESDDAWILGSRYQKVMARLFDFETKFAQIHRFQQARIEDRDIQTLENQRNYWAPWLSGQFLFHAIQGLINHPFLHIASRSKQQIFPPPSFLQNSIDQAVLHSSWILKCIEVSNETGFIVHDPFIAHVSAVTATIYLFLLNAKDEELASQARLGFERCFTFLQNRADTWPHLRHTIDKLNILQHAALTNSSVPANRSAPKAQRSLLWELLDYSASTTPSQVPEFASDAVDLNVDTRFLSPLNPLSTGHTPASAIHLANPQQLPSTTNPQVNDQLWDPAMDSFDFNLFDNEQMADLTNLTFGRDLWSFGQL